MLLPSLPVWLLSAAPKDPAELERDVPEPIDAHGDLADAITAAITAVDLVGVFFFAISGAVLAVRKGYDIVGSLLLALMVGTGGGVVRDLVVGRDVPAAFDNPWYLILPAVASLAVFLRIFDGERGHHAVMAFDAIGLAVYCVVGTRIALLAGLSPVAAAVLGLVTAVGGGILRDVVAGEPPAVFGGRGWYALPAILGAGTTAATTSSPECSLGSPTTATSATPGCWRSTFSTSVGATLNPPVMISSLMRSTIRTNPASSIVTMSPVRNHPSTKAASLSSGLP